MFMYQKRVILISLERPEVIKWEKIGRIEIKSLPFRPIHQLAFETQDLSLQTQNYHDQHDYMKSSMKLHEGIAVAWDPDSRVTYLFDGYLGPKSYTDMILPYNASLMNLN